MDKRHIITVLVLHKPSVLQRISGLFARRWFNISSITVGTTENPDIARMTIVVKGDDTHLEQVLKQLNKLVEVVKVKDLKHNNYVERELCIVKIHAPTESGKSQITQYANIFRGSIVDLSAETITVEITGDESKINAFLDLVRPLGIKEVARTGLTALMRGSKILKSNKK
ncbi:acetolactate synthase-1/3 small subunit [Methanococcus voltae]|uniref:Acetolactate synthase small subunit n=2 Tax=Methanococcus voltae TaxID=2188 RepID=A0A8J7S4S3_METVO|nr:acetolactate synthase small subunit [Methanococcus voltae]MBP2143435.1 acetolactate synthase-1/3 small subunit [Methanococcus voltae]MBP2172690.1 acetolactate synthase-1/3 small subunit [Methanococcus voltae]MBP2201393.1 acetolactate synthase-1/3 small subunit [Methanococcus voltae]MCS3922188.1 acetolactate synthase-1/3 small subunit [Methanococcus voltae PS]